MPEGPTPRAPLEEEKKETAPRSSGRRKPGRPKKSESMVMQAPTPASGPIELDGLFKMIRNMEDGESGASDFEDLIAQQNAIFQDLAEDPTKRPPMVNENVNSTNSSMESQRGKKKRKLNEIS